MLPMYKNLLSSASAAAKPNTTFLSSPNPNPNPNPNGTAPSRPGDESYPNFTPSASMFTPLRLMLVAASWLRLRRSRFLFLLLCSPLLLPLLCVTFPILCAAELCSRICRRRRRKAAGEVPPQEEEEDERLRRCEEGCSCESAEVGLLQRYLEDQLMLVGSVYDCGNEIDDGGDDRDLRGDRQETDYRVPLLS